METIEAECGKDFVFSCLADVEKYATQHNMPYKREGDGSLTLYVYDQQGKEQTIRFVESPK